MKLNDEEIVRRQQQIDQYRDLDKITLTGSQYASMLGDILRLEVMVTSLTANAAKLLAIHPVQLMRKP